jgi:hypothetical protein
MRATRWLAIAGLGVMALLVSGCSLDIDRNTDGSLSVAAKMSAESLQEEINAAIRDPLVEELDVALHDNYILVTGDRRRASGDEIDELTFRLDLSVEDGHLAAAISDAQVNHLPIDEDRVARWNQRIADNLTRAAHRRPNSTLNSVQITQGGVVTTWHIETARSRGN